MILLWLLRVVSLVEKVARFLTAIMMMLIMLIVATDVVMRYAFNSPLTWVYDFVSLYLMVGVFFLVISDAYISGAHVAIDLLLQHMPARLRIAAELAITACSVSLFVLISWAGAVQLVQSFTGNDVLAGRIPWPTWPGYAFISFGASLLAIRLVVQFVARAASLATGRTLFPEASPRMDSASNAE